MSTRKILGALLLVGGVILIIVSVNVKSRAEMGEMRISNAEEQVSEEDRPYLRPIPRARSRATSEQAEERIGEGTATVANYEQIAMWLKIGGIICVVLGAGALFVRKQRR